jgi:transcriptional regulator with XRE-family HTH domain
MSEMVLDSLAEKLKKARMDAKLSILEVAGKAGVSSGSISKIEKGKMVPTILTLLRIVRVYNKPLGFFVEEELSQFDCYTSQSNRRRKMSCSAGTRRNKFELELISAPFATGIVDAGIITLAPGVSSAGSQLNHSGEELGYCLKGRFELVLGERRIILEEGDSVHFNASMPHNYRNIGCGEGRIIYFIAHSRK